MNKTEIISRLTPIAQNVFEKDDLVLTDDLSSETLDSWTSLSFMHLLSAIEHEFGFKFKMMEVLSIKSMGNIINTIANHC